MPDTYRNVSAEVWDEQYRTGRWDYLSNVEQIPRYALIAAWIECLRPKSSVLDIGCGEGILMEWLRTCNHYEGVDFSQVAIERARNRPRLMEEQLFHCASAEAFYQTCRKRFDCIVFNETVYCCAEPVRLLTRYERLLEPGGYLIISITGFESTVWKDIQMVYGHRFARCLQVEDLQVMKSWKLAVIPRGK